MMKNKKILSHIAYAVIGLLSTNHVYAGIPSQPEPPKPQPPDRTIGYGSSYPLLLDLPETFSRNDSGVTRLDLSVQENTTINQEEKTKTFRAVFGIPAILDDINGKTTEHSLFIGQVIGTKSLNGGKTKWQVKIYNDPSDPRKGFNGSDWFRPSKILTAVNSDANKKRQEWEMSVPIQYRIVMQLDGQGSQIDLKDYEYAMRLDKENTTKPISTKDSLALSAETVMTPSRIPVRKISFYTEKFSTNKGETKLSVNAYHNMGWKAEKQIPPMSYWMVVSNLDFTHYKNTWNNFSMDLAKKGFDSFMGKSDLIKTDEKYISNTTIDLKNIDQLPELMQQYRPIQGMTYEMDSSPGSYGLLIELSASSWTGRLQYDALEERKIPFGNRLEISSARVFIKIPKDFWPF